MDNKYEGYIKPLDGKIDFPNEVEKRMFHTFLTNFEGENLWIEIHSKSPTRSQRQHKYYWVYMEKLAEYTGYSKNEFHNECKWKFLRWTAKPGISGKSYISAPSTKELTKKEFNEYIREIELWTEVQAPSKEHYKLN